MHGINSGLVLSQGMVYSLNIKCLVKNLCVRFILTKIERLRMSDIILRHWGEYLYLLL